MAKRKMLCGARAVLARCCPARRADVSAGHEGTTRRCRARDPLSLPRSEGFARKFQALIQRRSRARLLPEPAQAGPSKRALLLLLVLHGNAPASSANARAFER